MSYCHLLPCMQKGPDVLSLVRGSKDRGVLHPNPPRQNEPNRLWESKSGEACLAPTIRLWWFGRGRACPTLGRKLEPAYVCSRSIHFATRGTSYSSRRSTSASG